MLLLASLVLGLVAVLELLVLEAGCSTWDELVEPVPLVEPVLLVEPVALILPLLVDVSLVAVEVVSASVLLLRVSRLQPANVSARAANAASPVTLSWWCFM